MKVLLVAPHSDLSFADEETQDWLSALQMKVVPLLGQVGVTDVARALRGQEFDLIAFICHGSEEGVQLSPGHFLDRGTLASLIRGRVPHVFFNTCSSLMAAQTLQSETAADVVCTVGPVDDQRAYTVGTMLALYLDRGAEFGEAYTLSRPGENRDYLYLAALPAVAAHNFRVRR